MNEAIVVVDLVSSSLFYKSVIKEMGFKLIAVYTKPVSVFAGVFHLPEETLITGCDEVMIGDSKAKVIEELKKSKFKVKAVIPGADSGVCLADELTDALHLFGNPVRHSKARREKGEMRRHLKKEGFSCPDFRLCKTEKELREFAKERSFPLVIKTPQGACTHHVYICDDEKKLVRNFHAILNEKDVYGGHADYAIVEEFISGKEYIVNTFSNGERVFVTDIWAYDKIDSETFHNIYYNCFSLPLSDPTVKPLIDLGVKLSEAFEVKRGPAHLEIMDDPRRGPTLIEINARLAGARIPLFMKKHSNFDPYKKTIEVLVHGKTPVPDPIIMKKYCAWVCCPIFEGGKIEKINGIHGIEKLSSYDGHQLNIKTGDLITATTDFSSMPLVVFLAHEERKELLKDVEKTHALFEVTFSEKATGT